MLNVSLSVLGDLLGWTFYVLIVPIALCISIGACRECWNGSKLQRNFQKTSLAKFKEQQTQQFIKNRLGEHHNQVLRRSEISIKPSDSHSESPMHPLSDLNPNRPQDYLEENLIGQGLSLNVRPATISKAKSLNHQGSYEVESGSVWAPDEDRVRRRTGSLLRHAETSTSTRTPRSLNSGNLSTELPHRDAEREDDHGSTWAQEERITPLRHSATSATNPNSNPKLGLALNDRDSGVVQRVSKIWQKKRLSENSEHGEGLDLAVQGHREMHASGVDSAASRPGHAPGGQRNGQLHSVNQRSQSERTAMLNGGLRVVDQGKPSGGGGGVGMGTGGSRVGLSGKTCLVVVGLVAAVSCFVASLVSGLMCIEDDVGGKPWASARGSFGECLKLSKATKLAEDYEFCGAVGVARAPFVTAKVYILLSCATGGLRKSLQLSAVDVLQQLSQWISTVTQGTATASSKSGQLPLVSAEMMPLWMGFGAFVALNMFTSILRLLLKCMTSKTRRPESEDSDKMSDAIGKVRSLSTAELEAEAEQSGLLNHNSLSLPPAQPFDGGLLARQLSSDVLMDLKQRFEVFHTHFQEGIGELDAQPSSTSLDSMDKAGSEDLGSSTGLGGRSNNSVTGSPVAKMLLQRGFSSPEVSQSKEVDSVAASHYSDSDNATTDGILKDESLQDARKRIEKNRFRLLKRNKAALIATLVKDLGLEQEDLKTVENALDSVVSKLKKAREHALED